jgi:hypothetical protein
MSKINIFLSASCPPRAWDVAMAELGFLDVLNPKTVYSRPPRSMKHKGIRYII